MLGLQSEPRREQCDGGRAAGNARATRAKSEASIMYRPGTGPLILCVSALLLLASCGEQGGQGSARSTATAAAERPAATRLTQREVEAPQVFQKSEAALWDGRPSLGGVWVAHPDVADPERVLIRNEATGETVVGALFRRERDNPGPRFQVSSDAAAALGLMAGAPTKLSVTALRREEAPADAEPEAEERAVAAADTPAASTGEETPERGGFFAFLRGGEDGAAGEPDAEAPQPADSAVDPSEIAEVDVAATPASEPSGEAQDGPARRGFLFGLFNREGSDRAARAEEAAAGGAEDGDVATTALPEAAPDSRAALERGLVQIGIFSIEGNADRTAEMMRENGLTPTVYEHASAGKSYWRVVVGPATTRDERDRLQARARSLGFTDAFPVSR